MGISRFMTVKASTKRAPVISAGKRGAPQTLIIEWRCAPLDPVDPELQQRLALNTPLELLQTFIEGNQDVVAGDLLVVAGVEYPVRRCAEWEWRGTTFRHLVLEDLKR